MTVKKRSRPSKKSEWPDIGCVLKELPKSQLMAAATIAVEINPVNQPALAAAPLWAGEECDIPAIERIAVMTTKYWGPKGVRLGVAFMDSAPSDLQSRILSHMNAWGQNGRSNVTFLLASRSMAEVRIAREPSGYWSYLGTDILSIPKGQQTMNLQGFTMSTPDSEFYRVVRHETGHTLGFPHEHMRRAIIALLDRSKTVAYFQRTQGWSEQEVIAQVLTPLEEASLIATPTADETSIMTYQLPGSITKSGVPVKGGVDINQIDYDFCASIYPGTSVPPSPPPSGGPVEEPFSLVYKDRQISGVAVFEKNSLTGTIRGTCSRKSV